MFGFWKKKTPVVSVITDDQIQKAKQYILEHYAPPQEPPKPKKVEPVKQPVPEETSGGPAKSDVRYSVGGSSGPSRRYSVGDTLSSDDAMARILLSGDFSARSINEALSRRVKPTFVDKLSRHIAVKQLRDPQVYKAAQMDRRLFSKMMSDRSYTPRKDTCLALCFALRLNLDETKEMLSAAGFAFSQSNKRDIVLEYMIQEKIYNLIDANEILDRLDMKPLSA